MATIVMTGGTSGLGRFAAERLVSPETTLLLGARRPGPPGTETLALDLARLDRVRSFAAAVADRLGPARIDALVLNAGLSLPHDRARTVDGFETTFAVNHLAHYLLLRLLLPRLAHGATVILTTSSTHDPAEATRLAPPRHANAQLLAHPEHDPARDPAPLAAGGFAYTSSKLCNILTARGLAALPEPPDRRLTVIAYDPGPTPGTGLVRSHGAAIRLVWRLVAPSLRPLSRRFNSPRTAGRTLADLALGTVRPPAGQIYGSLRHTGLLWQEPSELARSDDVMRALWHDSARLLGLPDRSPADGG